MIREMHTKITLKNNFHLLDWQKFKDLKCTLFNGKTGVGGTRPLITLLVGMQNGISPFTREFGNIWQVVYVYLWLSNPNSRNRSRRYTGRNTEYPRLFIATVSVIVKDWKQPRCLPGGDWLNKSLWSTKWINMWLCERWRISLYTDVEWPLGHIVKWKKKRRWWKCVGYATQEICIYF